MGGREQAAVDQGDEEEEEEEVEDTKVGNSGVHFQDRCLHKHVS